MKNVFSHFGLLLILFCALLLSSNTTAQNKIIGKIIKTTEANALFGPVQKSEVVSKGLLKMIMKKTPDRIMLAFINGKVHVLDIHRNVEHPSNSVVKANDIFHVYSSSVLEELLNLDGGATVSVEERANNIMTITTTSIADVNMSYTLEYAVPCPPVCGE